MTLTAYDCEIMAAAWKANRDCIEACEPDARDMEWPAGWTTGELVDDQRLLTWTTHQAVNGALQSLTRMGWLHRERTPAGPWMYTIAAPPRGTP